MKIPQYHGADKWADNIAHPVLKAFFKYRNHISINTTKNFKTREIFELLKVSFEDVVEEIRQLNRRKATQNKDRPVKIVIQINGILGPIYDFCNECINTGHNNLCRMT